MPLWAKYVPLFHEEPIMIIRAKTFKKWFFANFDWQDRQELSRNGANTGWPGLSFHRDTCKLYDKFKEEIWEMLLEDTESFGCKNVFELMSSFSTAKDVTDCTQFENGMVWYAAERLAHQAG